MANDEPKKPVKVSREELYRQVWETPMQRLAAQYGISGNGLAKICDRLRVPYPPRGYWAKREAGKTVRQLSLPPAGADTPNQVTIAPTPPKLAPSPPPQMSPEVQQLYDAAMRQAAAIAVPDSLRKPHPVIAAQIAEHDREIAAAKRDRFAAAFAPKPYATVDHRRHRILDTLYKELEKRGFTTKTERFKGTWLEIGRERVDVSVSERIRQERRPLTPEQQVNTLYSGQRWTQVKIPTGELVCRISTHLGAGVAHEWADKPDKPLEQNIREIIATLALAGPILKKQREVAEERERLRIEAERLRQQAADQRRRENNRFRRFLELADRWAVAESARAFLAALESSPAPSEVAYGERTHEEWLAWLKSRLSDYDPLTDGVEPVWQNLSHVASWEYRD